MRRILSYTRASIASAIALFWSFPPCAAEAPHHRAAILLGGEVADARIINGIEVEGPDVYPFYVNWDNKCGGSLVHPDIVLTAAHCTRTISSEKPVVVGAYLRSRSDTPGAETRTIESITTHPDFDPFTLSHDYALLKLSRKITTIDPIAMNNNTNFPSEGQELTIIGMGKLSEGGSLASKLHFATVPVVSDDECKALYNGTQYDVEPDVMFCAGYETGGIDACQGDSGGPIFSVAKSGEVDKQIGIISWGIGCGRPDRPGVYSEISTHIDWVVSQICAYSSLTPEECPEPTQAPTPVPPKEGEAAVMVSVTTDRFPAETGWYIIDSSGRVVEEVAPNTYTKQTTEHITWLNLKQGHNYIFNITDDYGDGMCCNYGDGAYTLRTGDIELAKGNQYGAFEATSFVVPVHADFLPPSLEEEIIVEIFVLTDKLPRQIEWSLQDGNANTILYSRRGSYTSPNTVYFSTVSLQSGVQYNFTITDGGDDGVCCTHGYGGYKLIYSDQVLASGNDFQSKETTIFVAPFTPAPSPSPSEMPTQTPTFTPLREGEVLVEVTIVSDKFPWEIGWSMYNSSNRTIASVPVGTYTTPYFPYTTKLPLQEGQEYSFTITDSYGDGICCLNGNGSYIIALGDDVLATGNNFSSFEATTFIASKSLKGQATPDDITGQVTVGINIFTDEYPREVEWFLYNTEGSMVMSSPLSSYFVHNSLVTKTAILDSGKTYNFTIVDKGGDGLCCKFGRGNYSVTVGNLTLASGADFGAIETTMFTAPGYHDTVTCSDTNETFTVDSDVGSQDCLWLSEHKSEFPWLCDHVDVTIICPVVCDACRHLSKLRP